MTVHDLKTWPQPWNETAMGRKTVEVRHNDRGFKVGDTLVLREWDPRVHAYTGGALTCKVREVHDLTPYGILDHVAMRIGEVREVRR